MGPSSGVGHAGVQGRMASVSEQYARDGFVILRRVFAPEHLAMLDERLESLVRVRPTGQVLFTHRPPPPGQRPMCALMDQWFGRLQREESAGPLLASLEDLVSGVVGTTMSPFQDVALRKAQRHQPFPWHQDLPYWPVDLDRGAISWVPLDPVSETNGALWLAAGSHRGPVQAAVDLHDGTLQDGSGDFVQVGAAVCVSLEPGDVLVFDARCAHRSGVNRCEADRRAWAISWTDAAARWAHARAPRHPLTATTTDGEEVRKWSHKTYLSRG